MTVHNGRKNHPIEYRAWRAAKGRCYNPNHSDFKLYGGKGVTMSPEWRNDFVAFLKHVGPRPEGTSLDRFPNPNGNYEPDNVRWATPIEQANNRRNSRVFTYNGETLSIAQWAKKLGMDYDALLWRLEHWPIEKAFTDPKFPNR